MKRCTFSPSSYFFAGVISLLWLISSASAQSPNTLPPGLEPECPVDCGDLAKAGVTEIRVEVVESGEKYTRNLCRLDHKGQVLENSVFYPDGSLKQHKEYIWEKGRLQGIMTTDQEGKQYVDHLTWDKKNVSGTYRKPSETASQVYFLYDNKGRLAEIRKGKNRKESKPVRLFKYDDQDRLLLDSAVAGPSARKVSHKRYDHEGRVVYQRDVTYWEGNVLENVVESVYNERGLLQEERVAGPGGGGMLHRLEYSAEGQLIREEWGDAEGAMDEKMTYQYSLEGKRTDSKVFRAGSSEKAYAEGYEIMDEDGLPLEAQLKESDLPAYQWFYHYTK